ncbi:glycosyltransferase [Cyanobium sp. Cruz-8H5]|uniref:glycosyltransferase family 2 protein n=1 Tax=Cyanobium sp. Cruz-8H5 TaxID=2823712 RepID=UPI0028F3FCFB|nr:glycosyltransferase [Cyanobium sp. Cruz-8H5]
MVDGQLGAQQRRHSGPLVHAPVVTIVIPTFGRPLQLQACLAALAVQTLPEPWEVVVVDDGSPQPLEGVALSWSGWFDLRVIRQDNSGPAAARNRGVQEARGTLIAFTDDDCLPDPQWLDTLVRAAQERPSALVGGATLNGLGSEFFASTSQLIVDLVYEHFNADPDNSYFFASNNMLCPRDCFLSLGGFDSSFPRAGAEDRDFCDRWRISGWPLIWRPDARVEHRHSQSLRKFIDLHIRYGRGAYLYQARRKQRRSGSMQEDLSFHLTLFRRVRHHLAERNVHILDKLALVAALALWQVANAVGFFIEALSVAARRSSFPSFSRFFSRRDSGSNPGR